MDLRNIKLEIYKFLGFMPYFNNLYKKVLKTTTVKYYNNDWNYIQKYTYKHSSIPAKGNTVILKNIKYIVMETNDIKILLKELN